MSGLLLPLALGIALTHSAVDSTGTPDSLPPPPAPIALAAVLPPGRFQAAGSPAPLRPTPLPGILYGEGGATASPGGDPAAGPRPKAVEYSDLYYTRLTIHKYASYATLPLFIAEYFVGQKLIHDGPNASDALRGTHGALAGGIAVLFGINTVTGLWNLWDARKDPAGRTRRTIHSILMLAADAGFVATGATAPGEREGFTRTISSSRANTHRALAISSMSLATASYLMMLIWKD